MQLRKSLLAVGGTVNGTACVDDYNRLTSAISDPLSSMLGLCSPGQDVLGSCFTENAGEYSITNVPSISSTCATCAHTVLSATLSDGTSAASCMLTRMNTASYHATPSCYEEIRERFRESCGSFSYPERYACTGNAGFFTDPAVPFQDVVDKCDQMTNCFTFDDATKTYTWPSMGGVSTGCATCIAANAQSFVELQTIAVSLANCVADNGEVSGEPCIAAANSFLLSTCFATEPVTTEAPTTAATTTDSSNSGEKFVGMGGFVLTLALFASM